MTNDSREEHSLAMLGAHFAELNTTLSQEEHPLLPDRLVAFAARAVPHSAHAGLTVIAANGKMTSRALTGDLPRAVDALQYELEEGPCVSAALEDEIVRSEDLEHDARWPRFGPECATKLGVQSMFSVRVALADAERAALNFYATTPYAFDEDDVGVGVIFAMFVGLALHNQRTEEKVVNLEAALQSNRQIGTATGILMAQEKLTSDQAFARLTEASQHLNRKLRDIAVDVALTGRLPQVPGA